MAFVHTEELTPDGTAVAPPAGAPFALALPEGRADSPDGDAEPSVDLDGGVGPPGPPPPPPDPEKPVSAEAGTP
jgi:hypothetical protein